MADIKRFTGFIAIDGSTHDTLAKATAHTKEVKIGLALKEFAVAVSSNPVGFSVDDRDNHVLYPEDLPNFLLKHRVAIQAAFNQSVVMRDAKSGKKAVVKTVKATAEKTLGASPAESLSIRKPTVAPAAVTPAVSAVAQSNSEDEAMTLV